MKISDVIRRKGTHVITVRSDDTVAQFVSLLAEHNIGAAVVSDDEKTVIGIVSERDIARRLRPDLAQCKIADIMTTQVYTCSFDDDVSEMAGLMTEHHIRHLPVIEDGSLSAVVSIGDIVKARIDQLKHERDQLESYITQ